MESIPAKTGTDPKQRKKKLSLKRKLFFSLIAIVLFACVSEIFARVISYVAYGFNPYYLLYGYKSWTNEEGAGHSEKLDGYFKFPSNSMIKYGTPSPCLINNHGFRGKDFSNEKPAGIFRIICMGASSTFGYLNHDDGTYPFLLERLFEEKSAGSRVEVINTGIPHFNTSNIRAMFEKEILGYQPDLITIYTGFNDACYLSDENIFQSACRWLDEHSAAYAGLRKLLNRFFGRVLYSWWDGYLPRVERALVVRQADLHVKDAAANLTPVLERAREHGIQVVLIRQAITLWFDRVRYGEITKEAPRTTYEAEYRSVVERLERDGRICTYDALLYVHHALMDLLTDLAERHCLPVVDNIKLQKEHPENLGSPVHLTEEGNARLAAELHRVIRPMIMDGK